MTFAWKKDNEILNDAEIHNQAHLRVQVVAGNETEVTEYTTTLHLRNVQFFSEGKYQCVISNHFGSSYSTKARLTVNREYGINLYPQGSPNSFNNLTRLSVPCLQCSPPSPRCPWT